MREDTSFIGSGVAGNNIAQNTNIASVLNIGPGRYRLNGSGRHTLADGLKITGIPSGTIVIPGGAGDTVIFPDLIFDLPGIATTTFNIQVALNVATGAADTAAAILCLEKINH